MKDTHATVAGHRDGERYSATDPELLRWVHATLVDSAIVTYERFVGRIGPAARERYHKEMKAQAAAFGVPTDRLPHTYRDFCADFDRTVTSLEVSDEARRLARGDLDPPVPAGARPVVHALASITAGLLPDPIRRGYGIAWSEGDERGVRSSRRSSGPSCSCSRNGFVAGRMRGRPTGGSHWADAARDPAP